MKLCLSLTLLLILCSCASQKPLEPVSRKVTAERIRAKLSDEIFWMKKCMQGENIFTESDNYTVGVEFVINKDGRVDKLQLSNLPSQDSRVCLRRTIGSIKFAPIKGGGSLEVSQPIVFHARYF